MVSERSGQPGKQGAKVGGPFWEISKREKKTEKVDYKEKVQQEQEQLNAVPAAIENIIQE